MHIKVPVAWVLWKIKAPWPVKGASHKHQNRLLIQEFEESLIGLKPKAGTWKCAKASSDQGIGTA